MSDAPAYAETLYPQRELGWAPLFAWRTSRHKMIEAPKPGALRPREGPRRDAEPRRGARTRASRRCSRSCRRRSSRPAPAAAAEVDPETAERLRALGYVGGGGGAPVAPRAASLRDPKDGVRLLPGLNNGMIGRAHRARGRHPRADAPCSRRTPACSWRAAPWPWPTARPGSTTAPSPSCGGSRRRRALSAEDEVVLGDNLRFAGRLDEAAAVLEETARKNPRFAQPWISLAEVHIKQEKLAEATAAYEHVLADRARPRRGPPRPRRPRLPRAERRRGRPAATPASSRSSRATPGAMTKLGVVRMRTGRPDEAIALFRRAIEREPKNGEALLYLAGALASSGHAGRGAALLRAGARRRTAQRRWRSTASP